MNGHTLRKLCGKSFDLLYKNFEASAESFKYSPAKATTRISYDYIKLTKCSIHNYSTFIVDNVRAGRIAAQHHFAEAAPCLLRHGARLVLLSCKTKTIGLFSCTPRGKGCSRDLSFEQGGRGRRPRFSVAARPARGKFLKSPAPLPPSPRAPRQARRDGIVP